MFQALGCCERNNHLKLKLLTVVGFLWWVLSGVPGICYVFGLLLLLLGFLLQSFDDDLEPCSL